jgi:hypothetical protein
MTSLILRTYFESLCIKCILSRVTELPSAVAYRHCTAAHSEDGHLLQLGSSELQDTHLVDKSMRRPRLHVTLVLSNQLLNDVRGIRNKPIPRHSVRVHFNPNSTKHKTATHMQQGSSNYFQPLFNTSITLSPSTIDNLRIIWLQYVSLASSPLGEKCI